VSLDTEFPAHLRRKPVDVIPIGRPFLGRSPTFLSCITERKLAARKGGGADEAVPEAERHHLTRRAARLRDT